MKSLIIEIGRVSSPIRWMVAAELDCDGGVYELATVLFGASFSEDDPSYSACYRFMVMTEWAEKVMEDELKHAH